MNFRLQNRLLACFVVIALLFGAGNAASGQTRGGRGKKLPLAAANPADRMPKVMLRVDGVELWQGKYEFTNVGVNAPTLFSRLQQGKTAEARGIIEDSVKAGVRLLRVSAAPQSYTEAQQWAANADAPAAVLKLKFS